MVSARFLNWGGLRPSRIFSMWEQKEVKGERSKKAKLDHRVEMKSKSLKVDLVLGGHCKE